MSSPTRTPMILGHRGASAYAPENTLAAFDLAGEQGADGVELDVKLSADDQAVVIHDQSVDRTTDGNGRVNRLTLTQLKQLDAGSFFDRRFSGEKIPTLDQVFEHVGKRLFINVELTNYASQNDKLIQVVAEVVRRHTVEKSIMFSSFSWGNLRKIKILLPQVPVGLLAQSGLLGAVSRSRIFLNISPDFIHPHFSDVDSNLIEREKARGRRVNVWTVNDEPDIRRMIAQGVHTIMTDDPIKAISLLERK